MSYAAMKGYMSLKSSPYSVTSSKYSTQLLVKSNMDAHQRMINSAKCSVDNKCPKVYQSSQKVRDQLKRDMIKYGRPPPSRSSSKASLHSEERYKEELFDDDPVVGEIVRNHLPRRGRHSPQPEAVLTMRSPAETPRPAPVAASPRYQPATGDILEDRKHVFTQPEREFTPRTLKSTRKSKLSEFKYYNAPPVRKQNSKPKSDEKAANTSETLTFEPLRTRDMRQTTNTVPRLDITVDKDHIKWLEEQALKAQVRNSTRPNSSGAYKKPLSTRDILDHEEEELKYLEFVNTVTNDVLDRGIYTNKALQSVFDRHVEMNMKSLSVRRMNECLEKLRTDLGLSETNTAEKVPTIRDRAGLDSPASTNDTGLERYRRNLERTLRAADLDTSVATRTRSSQGPSPKHRASVMNETYTDTTDGVQIHPRAQARKHLLEGRSESKESLLNEDKSVASLARSTKSVGSVPKSVKSNLSVNKYVKSDASLTRNVKSKVSTSGNVQSDVSTSGNVQSDVPASKNEKSDLTVHESVKSNVSLTKSGVSEPNTSTSASSSPVRRQDSSKGAKSNSTLAENTKTSIEFSGSENASVKLNGHNALSRSDTQKSGVSSAVNDLDQVDAESADGSTIVEDGTSLNSTMNSLAEEHQWMKNPSAFTMTLRPGQLDMSVVKPRPRARRRMNDTREHKPNLVDVSQREHKPNMVDVSQREHKPNMVDVSQRSDSSSLRVDETRSESEGLGSTLTDVSALHDEAAPSASDARVGVPSAPPRASVEPPSAQPRASALKTAARALESGTVTFSDGPDDF